MEFGLRILKRFVNLNSFFVIFFILVGDDGKSQVDETEELDRLVFFSKTKSYFKLLHKVQLSEEEKVKFLFFDTRLVCTDVDCEFWIIIFHRHLG